MKSKTLNEIFNKTRRTPNISLTPEQVEELVKDLEILEIIKANMTIDDWENVRVKDNDDWNKVKEWLDNGK